MLHSELSNPPPPTPMLNSGRIFSQQSAHLSSSQLPQLPSVQRPPSNGARNSSSFGTLSEHAKSTVQLNTRTTLSHRLVSSFHNESEQNSFMYPSQPIQIESPKELKYSHLPAFSSSIMQEASKLPKSKSLTKICKNQQTDWVILYLIILSYFLNLNLFVNIVYLFIYIFTLHFVIQLLLI